MSETELPPRAVVEGWRWHAEVMVPELNDEVNRLTDEKRVLEQQLQEANELLDAYRANPLFAQSIQLRADLEQERRRAEENAAKAKEAVEVLAGVLRTENSRFRLSDDDYSVFRSAARSLIADHLDMPAALLNPDTSEAKGKRHDYRPSSDLIGSPCALCRMRPDDHDDYAPEQ